MKVVINYFSPVVVCLLFTFSLSAQSGPQCKPANCNPKECIKTAASYSAKADITKFSISKAIVNTKTQPQKTNKCSLAVDPSCCIIPICCKASTSLVSEDVKKVKATTGNKKTKV